MGAADRSIEGEWQGFEFRIIHDEDFEIVNEHLGNNFFRDEPISQLIGFTPEFVSDVSKIWRPTISQNLSLVATDKVTKKVAGVRISFQQAKGHKHPTPEINSPEAKKIISVLDQVASSVDIYEKMNVDRYAEFFLVSVDREFRGRGLAMELYDRSVALLKSNGFPYVKCIFSSPYSRRNGKKLGFEELLQKRVLDFTNEKGETLLPNAGPEQIVTLEILKL